MCSIYKITNLINNKVYIGQTQQNYLDRFIQHKSHARRYHSDHKLARAFRKYGDENFKIEEIEKCEYAKLDEREIYWIDYYNSTNDKYGYNILLGGQQQKRIAIPDNVDEIIKYYYNCHNQLQTQKYFSISNYKLKQFLHIFNLPTDKKVYGKHSRQKIKIIELNLIFDSETDCAKYFIDNNICKTKKVECALTRINAAFRKKTYKVYGYTLEKIGSIGEGYQKQ